MSGLADGKGKTIKRTRQKKWLRSDEASIINYIKQNPSFEQPTAQIYYNKFLFESGIDVDWKRVRYKVRNMRTVYRRAKEYGIKKGETNKVDEEDETLRNAMLEICWFMDDFDLLFPNEMENNNDTDIFPHRHMRNSTDDESSNQDSFSQINNSSTNYNEECLVEEPTVGLSSKSIKRDILAVQTGMYNFKKQEDNEDITIKQQELQLLREKFDFEKEKFREEIRVKEKEIETQERLKIMELRMKERIAMKEMELKERIATGKHENNDNFFSSNNLRF